jgi:sialic acid synthase SpsE
LWDHAASLETPGLFKLIRDIRNIEKAMGSPEKRIQEREIPIRTKLAKSVVATVDIPKGTVITREMLTVKGPNTGLPPKYIYILPGKRAVKDIRGDTVITKEMVE